MREMLGFCFSSFFQNSILILKAESTTMMGHEVFKVKHFIDKILLDDDVPVVCFVDLELALLCSLNC